MLLGVLSGIGISIVVTFCYILVIAFTVWMAIDAGKQDRFWWLVVVLGLPVIGPTVYYFTEKRHEYAKISPHHIHKSETEEQHENAPKKKKSRKQKSEVRGETSMEEVKQEETKIGPEEDEVTLTELITGEEQPKTETKTTE